MNKFLLQNEIGAIKNFDFFFSLNFFLLLK